MSWPESDDATTRRLIGKTPEVTLRRINERTDQLRYGRFAVGVEVLPYEVVAMLMDPMGAKSAKVRREVPQMDPDGVAHEIGGVARDLVSSELGFDLPSRHVAIGIQIGGPVDFRRGVVLSYANDPSDMPYAVDPILWQEPVPLAAMVEDETGCRTVIENDAVAYAVYEQKYGVGFDTDSFALILIRDGVGGAVVLNHHVLPIPCEVGHLKVTSRGRSCPCKNHGCVESVTGRRAIRAIAGERMQLGRDARNIQEAIMLAEGDHVRAADVLSGFREAGEAIAFVIGTLLTMFGVSHVVIYCDEAMMDPNSRAVAEFHAGVDTFSDHAFPVFRSCTLERHRWRSTDGAYGAALLALNKLFHFRLVDTHLHYHQPPVVQEA